MAVKFALAAFIVPFAFVYGPELLMIGPWHVIAISFITAVIGLILIAAALEAYLQSHLVIWERLLLAIAGFGLVMPSTYTALVSIVLLAFYFVLSYFLKRNKV
jgi:TRAP-type uncharacterized transport system fused permease subunit